MYQGYVVHSSYLGKVKILIENCIVVYKVYGDTLWQVAIFLAVWSTDPRAVWGGKPFLFFLGLILSRNALPPERSNKGSSGCIVQLRPELARHTPEGHCALCLVEVDTVCVEKTPF